MSKTTLTNERWQVAVDALIARDGRACHYCERRVITWQEAEAQCRHESARWPGTQREWDYRAREIRRLIMVLDHVVPRAAGGKDALDNLLLACSYCNGVKCAKPYTQAVLLIRQRIAKQGTRYGLFAQASGRYGASL